MKSLIAATFIAALGFAGAAQAMPVAPIAADTAIEHVAQGCGPGMARNAMGRCRPKFMMRDCRPGYRKNRFGVCRPMMR
jgi:hypothetical protein